MVTIPSNLFQEIATVTRPLSHFSTIPWASVVLLFALLTRSPEEISAADVPDFHVEPAQVRLQGNLTRTQLVVRATGLSGEMNDHSSDLTGRTRRSSAQAKRAGFWPLPTGRPRSA